MLIPVLRKYSLGNIIRGYGIGLFVALLLLFGTIAYCLGQSVSGTLAADLPSVPGWKIDGEAYRYGPDNLYQYIDGGAYFFIGYGFVELQGANFSASAGNKDAVTVDVYDMGDKLNAFGVYQLRKDDQAPALGIGAASFGSDDYLVFYKDRFYVEIRAFFAAEKDQHLLRDFASSVAEKLPGDSSLPEELAYLPEENRIMGSERFIRGGILGHEFFDQGLVCDYHDKADNISAFIAFFSSTKNAQNSLQQHKIFLQQAGKKWWPLEGFGKHAFVAEEPYHKKVMVAQQGRYVIGIYDLTDLASAKTLLANVVKRLPQQ